MNRRLGALLAIGSLVGGCEVGSVGSINPGGDAQCVQRAPLAADVQAALAALPAAHVVTRSGESVASFVRGHLGVMKDVHRASPGPTALAPIAQVFRIDAADLVADRRSTDASGDTHLFYQQVINGLRVIGGDLGVHVNARGVVYAAHGLPRFNQPPASTPTLGRDGLVSTIGELLGGAATVDALELAYMADDQARRLRLVWEAQVPGDIVGDGEYIVVDAHTGELIERRPMAHTLLDRAIYDLNNQVPTLDNLPGTLVKSEGGAPTQDPIVEALYTELGIAYDCFSTMFQRDSWDGLGRTIVATVHVDQNYNNAFFTDQLGQLAFGDGDGQLFGPFATSRDVVVHELAHGVTSSTADLEYVNESGALNEAMSDILAAACVARQNGGQVGPAVWMLAEDVYTPQTAGDAMRYMDNPTKDGISTDYYPTRYLPPNGQAPGPENDNGGVHINSGIANLAFKALVTGTSHPRAQSTATLQKGLGIEPAAKIFYRALTTYMNTRTNFEGARVATAQAALDLYGAHTAELVHQAWDVVGVPGSSARMPLLPPLDPDVLPLVRGTPQTALAGAPGAALVFAVEVPSGASNLSISITGGTGDADLYVRAGSVPSGEAYDHAPLLDGNAEDVTVAAPTAGTYYVVLHGFAAFSDVSLTADYGLPGDPGGTGGDTCQ